MKLLPLLKLVVDTTGIETVDDGNTTFYGGSWRFGVVDKDLVKWRHRYGHGNDHGDNYRDDIRKLISEELNKRLGDENPSWYDGDQMDDWDTRFEELLDQSDGQAVEFCFDLETGTITVDDWIDPDARARAKTQVERVERLIRSTFAIEKDLPEELRKFLYQARIQLGHAEHELLVLAGVRSK